MNITKISIVVAVIIGIVLFFILNSTDFFYYYGIPAVIVVNVIRVIEKKGLLRHSN